MHLLILLTLVQLEVQLVPARVQHRDVKDLELEESNGARACSRML